MANERQFTFRAIGTIMSTTQDVAVVNSITVLMSLYVLLSVPYLPSLVS